MAHKKRLYHNSEYGQGDKELVVLWMRSGDVWRKFEESDWELLIEEYLYMFIHGCRGKLSVGSIFFSLSREVPLFSTNKIWINKIYLSLLALGEWHGSSKFVNVFWIKQKVPLFIPFTLKMTSQCINNWLTHSVS